MKTLVVYSSLTGNTKMVAEAIAEAMPNCDIFSVQEAPATVEGYDLVAVGYWVDKGMPDARCKAWLEGLKDARIAFFGTLGAYPDSDHARECKEKAAALVLEPARGNSVLGSWLCMGKIDPKVLEIMAKMAQNVHPMTPERKARIEEASKHPNAEDCKAAQEFIRGVLDSLAN